MREAWKVYGLGKTNVLRLDLKEFREGFPQGESSFFVQRDGRQKKRHETSKRNLEAESISSRAEYGRVFRVKDSYKIITTGSTNTII